MTWHPVHTFLAEFVAFCCTCFFLCLAAGNTQHIALCFSCTHELCTAVRKVLAPHGKFHPCTNNSHLIEKNVEERVSLWAIEKNIEERVTFDQLLHRRWPEHHDLTGRLPKHEIFSIQFLLTLTQCDVSQCIRECRLLLFANTFHCWSHFRECGQCCRVSSGSNRCHAVSHHVVITVK